MPSLSILLCANRKPVFRTAYLETWRSGRVVRHFFSASLETGPVTITPLPDTVSPKADGGITGSSIDQWSSQRAERDVGFYINEVFDILNPEFLTHWPRVIRPGCAGLEVDRL